MQTPTDTHRHADTHRHMRQDKWPAVQRKFLAPKQSTHLVGADRQGNARSQPRQRASSASASTMMSGSCMSRMARNDVGQYAVGCCLKQHVRDLLVMLLHTLEGVAKLACKCSLSLSLTHTHTYPPA